MEFWSEESEEKLIELWKKHAYLYDISTKAFSDRVKKQRRYISQEMNVADWYITHHNAALGTKTQVNSTSSRVASLLMGLYMSTNNFLLL